LAADSLSPGVTVPEQSEFGLEEEVKFDQFDCWTKVLTTL